NDMESGSRTNNEEECIDTGDSHSHSHASTRSGCIGWIRGLLQRLLTTVNCGCCSDNSNQLTDYHLEERGSLTADY
ncbi:MAG: hypothetical protein QS721_15750, partial [Candidatus Endonucleobacter sp. (ex Gigantidas childressi)]|nr:hypothetical protein [Candidatus Endonucleobacter sp. (ex Gigantidas childressi)]